MNRKSHSRLGAGALATGLLAIGTLQAGATSILVANQSFETNSGADIVGWTGGFSDPATAPGNYGGYLANDAPATGSRFASIAANYSQFSTSINTGYSVVNAGETFTMTVAVGRYLRNSGTLLTAADYIDLVNLQVNGVTVASNTALTTGSLDGVFWADATVTYTASAGDVGNTVGIQLGGPTYTDVNQRRYFDNVRLETNVPEPSTGGLVLGSVVALLGYRKRSARTSEC